MRASATPAASRRRRSRGGAPAGQRGLSLVELMIGMALGLMLLSGVVSVTVKIQAANALSMKMSRLNQQMRSTLDVMVKDLQRAGYVNWRAALDNCAAYGGDVAEASWSATDFYQCVTPVMSAMGQLLPESLYDGGSECVLYSYDLDGDGGRNTADFELFGFKLSGGAVRTRTAGDTHSCDSGTWQALSDAEVVISALSFRIDTEPSEAGQAAAYRLFFDAGASYAGWQSSGPGESCAVTGAHWLDDKCVWRRRVTIELTGHLASAPDVSMSLTGSVALKNDHFQRESPF